MPYHGHLDPEIVKTIDELPHDRKQIVAALFAYTDGHYKRVRNLVIGVICIVAIGCALGLEQLHHQSDQRATDSRNLINAQNASATEQKKLLCWSSFNGRVVIRAIAVQGLQAPLNKQEKTLIASSPLFKALIIAAASNQKNVQHYTFPLIPLPTCSGHNPNPVDTKVLKAAGVNPKKVAQ